YHSVLQGPFCYLPHDGVVPGVLTVGDLCDTAAALAPRPVWLEGLVDGLNREVPAERLTRVYEPARAAYSARADGRLRIGVKPGARDSVAGWLAEQLASTILKPGSDAARGGPALRTAPHRP